MRVLLSAYACGPGTGSEPGVGWHWAIEVARLGYSTTVVTTSENRIKIEEEIKNIEYKNIKFIFYEPHRIFHWANWYKIWPFALGHRFYWYVWEHIYHFAWQYGAYRKINIIHKRTPFDVVHHITYGAVRRSTFMGNITNARFVFGPLGGGERSPRSIRTILSRTAKVIEFVRDMSIVLSRVNPFLRSSFKKAQVIYVKTAESESVVPKKYRSKVRVRLEIGGNTLTTDNSDKEEVPREKGGFRVLFVGRFLYWKGMGLGIRAFSKLLAHYPDSRLIMIGEGPEEKAWRELVSTLCIEDSVEWIPWVSRSDLKQYYLNSTIFLFPSLHDSSGNVVLESISNGLPVVCLDLGGPAEIVNETCAGICATNDMDANGVIDSLYKQMKELSDNRDRLEQMGTAARIRSEEYHWPHVVNRLYDEITVL